jgi:hypothetical protein
VLFRVQRVEEGGGQPADARAVRQLRGVAAQGAGAQHVPLVLRARLLLLQQPRHVLPLRDAVPAPLLINPFLPPLPL